MLELLCEAFVKCQSTRLRATVVYHLADCDKAGDTSHGKNVTFVLPNHGGEKLLDKQKVGNHVDIECLSELLLWRFKDCAVVEDAGIVDEHCGFPVCLSDGLGSFGNRVGGGDIDMVEVRIFWDLESRSLHVKDYHLGLFQCEVFDDLFSDATTPAGDDDHLILECPSSSLAPAPSVETIKCERAE